jgi:pilus assembly protein Flp/PilA
MVSNGPERRQATLTNWEKVMRSLEKLMKQLKSDEEGAALIEYTVLLAILLVAVIAVIGGVGTWVNGKWEALNTALTAT